METTVIYYFLSYKIIKKHNFSNKQVVIKTQWKHNLSGVGGRQINV